MTTERLKRPFVSRNPSELRGLCRLSVWESHADLLVVTPPSSEVCAGRVCGAALVCGRRNPSELRGLCRKSKGKYRPECKVVTPPSSEVCAGLIWYSSQTYCVVTPPSSEVCAGSPARHDACGAGRNPSELRGLCRQGNSKAARALRVVTPPSSEVCAGVKYPADSYAPSRNPSELRGLCRSRGRGGSRSSRRNPSELRGLCRKKGGECVNTLRVVTPPSSEVCAGASSGKPRLSRLCGGILYRGAVIRPLDAPPARKCRPKDM